MSRYFYYQCQRDHTRSDDGVNWGEQHLRLYLKVWPALKDADPKGWLSLHLEGYGNALSPFLEDHYQHGIEIVDEYGEVTTKHYQEQIKPYILVTNLLPEEERELLDSERCGNCNHLRVLHNEHCCKITACDCDEIPTINDLAAAYVPPVQR